MPTPTLVQYLSTGRDNGDQTAPSLILNLPGPAVNGNALIVGVEYDSSLTIGAITDNIGSNTWVAGPTISTGGQIVASFYALNVAAGTIKITIPFTGGGITNALSGQVAEFYNVQSSGAIGPTGSVNASASNIAITLSGAPTAGDLVWMWGADITTLTGNLSSITAGANFNLIAANRSGGKFMQYSVTTTSTTAAATTSGTDTFNAVALTLHSAAAGAAPASGIRVVGIHMELFDATTHTMQIPCLGNLLVGTWTSPDVTISAISDSGSNTWAIGTSASQLGGKGQIFYGNAGTPGSTNTLSLTYSGTSTGNNFVFIYDIIGAQASPHDVDHTTTGTQSVNGVLTTDSITPSNSGSLVINVTTIFQRSMYSMVTDGNGHLPLPSFPVNTKNDNLHTTPASTLAEDDGHAHFVTPNTTAITFIYSNGGDINGGTPAGVGIWESVSSVFKGIPLNPVTGNLLASVINTDYEWIGGDGNF